MRSKSRKMKPISVSAAREIAERFGYDQIVIVARRVGEDHEPHGEHVTTYGVDKVHCDVAARIGEHLKFNVMGWTRENEVVHEDKRRSKK